MNSQEKSDDSGMMAPCIIDGVIMLVKIITELVSFHVVHFAKMSIVTIFLLLLVNNCHDFCKSSFVK